MTADQRFAARRPDVLVYQTDVLDEDVDHRRADRGRPVRLHDRHRLRLDRQADRRLSRRLSRPEARTRPGVKMGGYQQLVRGDVMRGKFRNSFEKPEPFEPKQPTPVKFTLHDVCHTFRTGHRIMVQVQSTWFPLVDRNPQKFVDIYNARRPTSRRRPSASTTSRNAVTPGASRGCSLIHEHG